MNNKTRIEDSGEISVLSELLLPDTRKISADLARSCLESSPLLRNSPFNEELHSSTVAEGCNDDGLNVEPLNLLDEDVSLDDDVLDSLWDSNVNEVEGVGIGNGMELTPSFLAVHEGHAISENFLSLLKPNQDQNSVAGDLFDINESFASATNDSLVAQTNVANGFQQSPSDDETETFYDCKSTASDSDSDDKENKYIRFNNEDSMSELESDYSNSEFGDDETESDEYTPSTLPTVNLNSHEIGLNNVPWIESDKKVDGTLSVAATTMTTVIPIPKSSVESFPLRLTTNIEGKEVDALIGPSIHRHELIWLVKFKGKIRLDFVCASLMNKHFPHNVIQFYERRIRCSNTKSSVNIKALNCLDKNK